MARLGGGRGARSFARRWALCHIGASITASGGARCRRRIMDAYAGPLRLHDEIAARRGSGRSLPERRGPRRYRPAAPPPQMADRGYRHQDRHLAGLRDPDETEQDPGLYRRPDQPRRPVLWRGQYVGIDRIAWPHAQRSRKARRGGCHLMDEGPYDAGLFAVRLPLYAIILGKERGGIVMT